MSQNHNHKLLLALFFFYQKLKVEKKNLLFGIAIFKHYKSPQFFFFFLNIIFKHVILKVVFLNYQFKLT